MSLHVKVDRPHTIPGSYRTVVVTAEPAPGAEFSTESYSVTLLGVSKTRLITGDAPNQEPHESSATFLVIRKERCEFGPMLLEHGDKTQFHFEFPEDPLRGLDMDSIFNRRRPKPQSLPPSGEYGSGNTISYTFNACLIDDISHTEIRATAEVDFTPTQEIEAPDSDSIATVQDITAGSLDKSSSRSSFQLALESPHIIVQDLSFPLHLRLLDEKGPTPSSPPGTVLLKSCLVQLLENTCIQSETNLKDHWTKRYTIASRDFPPLEYDIEDLDITTEGVEVMTLLGDPCIPSTFASIFTSPNIQRTYSLDVCVTVELAGETHGLRYDLGTVTLLGAELGSVGRAREEEEAYDPRVAGPRPRVTCSGVPVWDIADVSSLSSQS